MKKVKVIFPDGSTADLDESQVSGAIAAGAKRFTDNSPEANTKSTSMVFPDGSIADVPESAIDGAMKAGAKKKVGTNGTGTIEGQNITPTKPVPTTSQLPVSTETTTAFDIFPKTPTVTTNDGVQFPVTELVTTDLVSTKNTPYDIQALQNRITNKTATPQDIEALAKSSGKSVNATNAYITKGKDNGSALDITENVSKTNQQVVTGFDALKASLGIGGGSQFNSEEILSSADKSSIFLQQINDLQQQDAKRKNIDTNVPTPFVNKEVFAPNIDPALSQQVNDTKEALVYNIRKLTAEEADKKGLTSEQSGELLYKRIDPTGYAKNKAMRESQFTDVANKTVTSTLGNPIQQLNTFIDWVSNKPQLNYETLNAEKGQYEIEANKGLQYLAIEKKAQGIVNNDQALIDEAATISGKIQNDDKIIEKYPLYMKQAMADYVNKRFSQEAGIMEGTQPVDANGQLLSITGLNRDVTKRYLKEGGFYDKANYKDYADEVVNNPATYLADNSWLGGTGIAFLKPFKSIFNTAADLVGVRSSTDRHLENVRDEMFPSRLTQGLKENISVDVAGHNFNMNVSNTINSVANLGGYIAATVATAGAGAEVGLSASTAQRLGAWASFGMDAVDSGLKEADKMGLTPAQSWIYAGMKGAMMAEGGRLLEFGKGAIPVIKGVNEDLAKAAIGISDKTLTEDAAKELLHGTSNAWVEGLKKYGIGTAKGAGVMTGFTVGDNLLKVGFGDKNVNGEEILPEAANAFFNGLFTMGVIGITGVKANIENAKNSTYKGMLNKVIDNHDATQDILKIGLEKDIFTQDEYDQKLQILNTGLKAKATFNKIASEQGVNFTPEQRSVWVANTTVEKMLRNAAEKEGVTEKKANEYNQQADNLVEQNTKILDGLDFNSFLEPKTAEFEKAQLAIVTTDTKLSEPIKGLDEQGIPVPEAPKVKGEPENISKPIDLSIEPLTNTEQKQWNDLSMEEKLKLAKENLPNVEKLSDTELATVANTRAKELLTKLNTDIPQNIPTPTIEQPIIENPILNETITGTTNEPIPTNEKQSTGQGTEATVPSGTTTTNETSAATADAVLTDKEQLAIDAIKDKKFEGGIKNWTDVLQDENSTVADKKQALKELSDQLNDPNSEVQTGSKLGQKVSDAIYDLENKNSGGGKEPPKNGINESTPNSDGEGELNKLASDIPNEGQLKEYASKGTIEKYHGETPENPQGIIVQELRPALEHGEKIIEKAKEVFGEKDYVEKTLDFIENSKASTQSKALMYISLENALAREKESSYNKLGIQKKQDLVRSKSQAFLRESSLAINFGKLRKIGEVGYDISKVTDNFFSGKEKEEKTVVEKSIEANADEINKEAEKQSVLDEEIQQKIDEAVESEINKIHEKLPTERRKNADKAIAALENFQKKIRGKAYESTIGVPLALIDSGITIIKHAIKAGVRIADAIDLGVQHIKKKYGKTWDKEGEFRGDMINGFREEGIKKEASATPSKIIKDALIESGFGKEITVTVNEKDEKGNTIKTKKGQPKPLKIKETRNIIDWKKLAGEEGSIDKMKENVSNVLEKQGYTKEEISDIQKDLADQYTDLRASIIEHSINELNKRNEKKITPEQKSAARKLAELYNYGLFEQDPVKYDVLLGKAIGIEKLSPERFEKAHELGKALQVLFSTKVNGKPLNDLQLKTALQAIDEKMRIILHDEAQGHGSTALKIADIVRTYMDATQRMVLNSLKQATENPLSGLEQNAISNIDRLFDNSSTKELRTQKRKVAASVYKDMVLSGGVNYGDVGTTFVSRGNLDAYINKMSDNKLVHAIASTFIGKTTLDAVDGFYKSKLTDLKFTHNLIKVLTQKRLVNGKIVEGMNKEDAVNFVSEKLTGQSFKNAQKTATDIIAEVNKGGKKILNDSPAFVNRLANDIVKAALVNGKVITTEQVTAAYNSAYKSAGRNLGHVPNNPISEAVQGVSGKIEKKINDAIKDKEYKKAALLTYQSIFFRNVLNPFVGGGTNWVVLKLEKNGLGLVSGLYNGGRTKLDLTSEAGLKNAEKALYEQARDRDVFMRGAIGGATALLTSMLWFGVANTDDYRKWRNKNKWATRYLDLITPESALATMAAKNKQLGYYVGTLVNKNDMYDKGSTLIKGIDNTVKGKTETAAGQIGQAVGSSFGIPVPWRLVRDGQNLWLGAEGKEPYKISSKPAKGFWEGAIKGGLIDYIKNNPAHKK